MFTEAFPIVGTADMKRALDFYRDGLGGTVTHQVAGEAGEPVYVGLDLGASHLGLSLDGPTDAGHRARSTVWVEVRSCDEAVDRLRAHGATLIDAPAESGSGDRVARLRDPDGNEIFVARSAAGPRTGGETHGARLISPEPERYMRSEFERRFLVDRRAGWRDLVESYSKTFEDLYIRHSHLRLRTLRDSATGGEFIKLTKKLVTRSPFEQLISSIPLSPMEYEFIAALPGESLRKTRYYHFHRGTVFAIDVFEGELDGLVLCEVETASLDELMSIDVPAYCGAEVTEDPFFTGGQLSRATGADLADRLATLSVPVGNNTGAG